MNAPSPELETVLRRAVDEGVVSDAQRVRVLEIAGTLRHEAVAASGPPPDDGDATTHEARRGVNAVTIAYATGALLVLFAFAWFLVDRWSRLGAWGVLGVAVAYGAIFVVAARWMERLRFPAAAAIAVVLAVAQVPLVAWSFLTMAGRWPHPASGNALLFHRGYMAWQWLVLELALILAALVVLRWRRIALLSYPLAIGLWGAHFHVGELLRGEFGSLSYDRWILLANALGILLVADLVERWQRREAYAGRGSEGDFAGPFWLVGFVAFTIAYISLWGRADDPWKHLMPFVALAVLAMAVQLRRRVVLAFGMLGIFGYLAFLADDVFRNLISFPILLAALGATMIVATVGVQRRFPRFVAGSSRPLVAGGRALPWSPIFSVLAPVSALVLALASLPDAADERAQQEFRERWYRQRIHSGSVRIGEGRPRPPRAPVEGASPR